MAGNSLFTRGSPDHDIPVRVIGREVFGIADLIRIKQAHVVELMGFLNIQTSFSDPSILPLSNYNPVILKLANKKSRYDPPPHANYRREESRY